jgi:hypothetical protein
MSKKAQEIVIYLAIGFVIYKAFNYFWQDKEEEFKAAPVVAEQLLPKEAPPPPPGPPLTIEDSKAFLENVRRIQKEWEDSSDALVRIQKYEELREYEKTFFSKTKDFVDWPGIISDVAIQDGGSDLCFQIRLGCDNDTGKDVKISQGCSGSYIWPDPNGIKMGTNFFDQLSKIPVKERWGKCFKLSGTVTRNATKENDPQLGLIRLFYNAQFTNIVEYHKEEVDAFSKPKKKIARE